MRRLLSVILLSIYLLAFSEAHQLFKVPVLLEHFAEHRHQDPDISFLSFLKIHYSGIFILDDDFQRDNQLPFRTADCLAIGVTVTCDCPPDMEWRLLPEPCHSEYILTNDNHNPLLRATDIFQPPRRA